MSDFITVQIQIDEARFLDLLSERVPQPQPSPQLPLWLSAAKAAEVLGDGFTAERVKDLGRTGEIIADRKDPYNPNSPYIFLTESLLEYHAKRVDELKERQKLTRERAERIARISQKAA